MSEKLSRLAELEADLAGSDKLAEVRLLGLLDFLRANIDTLVHQLGGVDEVVKEANKLYDLYVAPLDVPYIIEPFESLIFDNAAKRLIESIIRRLHDRVHQEG